MAHMPMGARGTCSEAVFGGLCVSQSAVWAKFLIVDVLISPKMTCCLNSCGAGYATLFGDAFHSFDYPWVSLWWLFH
jgi:hypothetical protein